MAMHLRHFTVEGCGEFPLDMLRYDTCWPSCSRDVDAMTHHRPGEHRQVRLSTYTPRKRDLFTTPERWRSFGWPVVAED